MPPLLWLRQPRHHPYAHTERRARTSIISSIYYMNDLYYTYIFTIIMLRHREKFYTERYNICT